MSESGKARTPGNKLPEISPTKASASKPGSSKQVAQEKQQSSLILEGSDPHIKLKNQVEILNSSNTSSPIHRTGAAKRTSHQTGGSGSKAIIPSKANILSSGNQPLSGVVIPSSSSNLGEDITEALILAGVTE